MQCLRVHVHVSGEKNQGNSQVYKREHFKCFGAAWVWLGQFRIALVKILTSYKVRKQDEEVIDTGGEFQILGHW